jgi:hypothetical protein
MPQVEQATAKADGAKISEKPKATPKTAAGSEEGKSEAN